MTPDQAATKLQGIYRSRVARTRFKELMRGVFEKCLDPATGALFYYNKRTGESSWVAPKIVAENL